MVLSCINPKRIGKRIITWVEGRTEARTKTTKQRENIQNLFDKSGCKSWSEFFLTKTNHDWTHSLTWDDAIMMGLNILRETASKNITKET